MARAGFQLRLKHFKKLTGWPWLPLITINLLAGNDPDSSGVGSLQPKAALE
jgi:hypothetical protein